MRRRPLASDALLAFAILGLLAVIAAKMDSRADRETTIAGDFRVVDGDTLRLGDRRLRLKGIDAPELMQLCRLGTGQEWPCGEAARRHLQGLVRDGAVTCTGSGRDRYGRVLAECRQGQIDVNARMVRDGMAVSYGGYRREETQARDEKRGLWAGTFEMPSRYRAEEREPWLRRMLSAWGF